MILTIIKHHFPTPCCKYGTNRGVPSKWRRKIICIVSAHACAFLGLLYFICLIVLKNLYIIEFIYYEKKRLYVVKSAQNLSLVEAPSRALNSQIVITRNDIWPEPRFTVDFVTILSKESIVRLAVIHSSRPTECCEIRNVLCLAKSSSHLKERYGKYFSTLAIVE